MSFNLVKALEPALYPIGWIWLLSVVFAIRCIWKRQLLPGIVFAAIATILSIVGSTSLPSRLLASLERPYLRESFSKVPECDAIVMLGGTMTPSKRDAFGFEFGDASDRTITAVELMRRQKAPVLVIGGSESKPKHGQAVTEAQLLQNWFAAWKIVSGRVIALPSSLNTRDEANHVRALMAEEKWKRVLLVTSAYHMKRAHGVFTKSGVAAEPVGCDFVAHAMIESPPPFSIFPRFEGFKQLNYYLHELIGGWYYKSRGWL